MKVYKGTNKDMKCRGMQYELGKIEKTDDAIRCGNKGFHSCEAPFDVLKYYPMCNGNRYFEAEADGKIDRTNADDSKIASSELTLKAEVKFTDMVKAQIEFTRKKAEAGTAGGYRSNLAGGDRSNLAGGYRSNLAGGDRSNLAGGDRSNLAGGYRSNLAGGAESNLAGGAESLIVARNGAKAKAGIRSVIVLTEWKWIGYNYTPVAVRAEIVDGEKIKANTWYKLENGEFVEVENG